MRPRGLSKGSYKGGEWLSKARNRLCVVRNKWGQSAQLLEMLMPLEKLVGTAGFEPATTTPPVWCATRLRYAPNRRESYPNLVGV